MSKSRTKRRPYDRLPVTVGDLVPGFRATDNPVNHLVYIHGLFLQELRSVPLLPIQNGIQKEFILGDVNEFWIMWCKQAFRREILVDDGLDLFLCKEFLRAVWFPR